MGGSAGDLPRARVRLVTPAPPAGSLRVQEDEDNCAVIQSARDALKLIQNKFLPAVRTWVQVRLRLGRACGECGEGAQPAG